MKIGALRLHQRTLKGLYFAIGSLTVLVIGVGLCFLIGLSFLPQARELPLR